MTPNGASSFNTPLVAMARLGLIGVVMCNFFGRP